MTFIFFKMAKTTNQFKCLGFSAEWKPSVASVARPHHRRGAAFTAADFIDRLVWGHRVAKQIGANLP